MSIIPVDMQIYGKAWGRMFDDDHPSRLSAEYALRYEETLPRAWNRKIGMYAGRERISAENGIIHDGADKHWAQLASNVGYQDAIREYWGNV